MDLVPEVKIIVHRDGESAEGAPEEPNAEADAPKAKRGGRKVKEKTAEAAEAAPAPEA